METEQRRGPRRLRRAAFGLRQRRVQRLKAPEADGDIAQCLEALHGHGERLQNDVEGHRGLEDVEDSTQDTSFQLNIEHIEHTYNCINQ